MGFDDEAQPIMLFDKGTFDEGRIGSIIRIYGDKIRAVSRYKQWASGESYRAEKLETLAMDIY